MTMYLGNDDLRPTGDEPAEFIEGPPVADFGVRPPVDDQADGGRRAALPSDPQAERPPAG
jgi:hypothetical protein